MIDILEITSSQNKIIKDVKSLNRRKHRWEKQLFIIEGIKLIQEALENGIELKYILYTDKLLSTSEGLRFYEKIKDERKLIKLTNQIFNEISDTETPQGIIGVARFSTKDIGEIISKDKSFLVYLDEIQDPGNMGTIIRSGDAFNIDGLILSKGCVDPYNSKVVRATMGSIFRLPLYFCHEPVDYLSQMKKNKFKIITTDLEGQTPKKDFFMEKLIIVIGNEANGVSKDIGELSDTKVKIPMLGQAESLNAGVAASIIMYEAMKARSLEL